MAKKLDADSTVNQRIKGDFVGREVKACFSYEMGAILKASDGVSRMHKDEYGLPSYEDIENLDHYECPGCGETEVHEGLDKDNQTEFKCSSCDWADDDAPDTTIKEIFEWWIVSRFLYDKLKDKGEAVLEWGNNYYWGRCTSGQAILLDGVISEICSEMEILQGQKYSWEKK